MLRALIRSRIDRNPNLALFLRNIRDLLDRRDSPRATPWGFKLSGHAAMAEGVFEPEETRLVRDLLQDVDILVNVGANIGYYCCHALSLGKPVIAVEPITRNLHYLLQNIRINGWAEQSEVYPVALGSASGILEMWGGGTGASLIKGWASIPENYVTQVPVLTLDRVLGDSLRSKRALILVDIEGAEWMMLQGAAATLKNDPRPVWMIEISATDHQPQGTPLNPHFAATFNQFFASGYRAWTVDAAAQEWLREDVEAVIRGRKVPSTHNFLFR